MNAEQEIKDAQKEWAGSNGITFDSRGYVCDLRDNLWRPLTNHALEGFRRGSGSELAQKMRALHSSSALVANFFDYWTDRDKAPLLSALGIGAGGAASLDFEKQFDTPFSERGQGNPPNLDFAIEWDSHFNTAAESKFTEWTRKRTKPTVNSKNFAEKYFGHSPGLWDQNRLPHCQEFAEEVRAGLQRGEYLFRFLDVEQLLKHALGLATQCGKGNFSLYYLYYDWQGESQEARKRSKAHKREIKRFADRVGEKIRFKALTYQEVYKRLRASEPADSEHADYLNYLCERYFSGKGAPS